MTDVDGPDTDPGTDQIKGPSAGRRVLGAGTNELRSLLSRSRDVMVLAAIIGAVTGLLVAALDRIIVDVILERVLEAPIGVIMVMPGLGLVIAAVLLRVVGRGATPSTTDEYIRAIPDPELPFDLRAVPGRLSASIMTLGLGGAGGLEGPSMLLGTAVGASLYERVRNVLRGVDRRAALVAGAAAGVAAIFKAPATGAVFALEVPYQEDLARRSLLPALVGGATGYSAFVAVNGTDPLFPVIGKPSLALADLGIAVLIGLTCGVGARVFAAIMVWAKHLTAKVSVVPRVAVGAVVLGALVLASHAWFDGEVLSVGPGYSSVRFALDPERGLWIIAVLATMRVVATASTVAGGGVVGMFVPLVVQGALTGRLLGGMFHTGNQSLYVLVGIAAFLGAGYRVPLAAVMFVAEATGQPGFVVPGLIAATVAQLVMAESSLSPYQKRRRPNYFADRAQLPIASVLSTDPAFARGDDTVAHFFTEHVSLARRRAVPIVDAEGRYEGLVVLNDLLSIDPGEWPEITLEEVARTDLPTGRPDWTMGRAMRAMVDAEVDHLPVVDDAGGLRGMVTSDAIVDRTRLMDRLEGEA